MLETDRIILRPMTKEDAQPIFAMRSDPQVMRFIRAPAAKLREAENWVNLVSSRWQEKIGFCSLIEKQSGKFLGWCGLWRLEETGEIEVGYAIRKEFWRRGYAAEAAEAFLKYGFEALNLNKIVAVARPENKASQRVMEKLGMRYDYTGEFYGLNLVHYTITREEFLMQRNQRKLAAAKNYICLKPNGF
jgi:ribosomal-protein-alanine N-acetyltransferase